MNSINFQLQTAHAIQYFN